MANRILIITGNAADAKVLEDALGSAKDGPFTIERVTQLSDGLKRLSAGGIDAIMADLSLPDSRGIGTFDTLFAAAPHTPIMVLRVTSRKTTLEATWFRNRCATLSSAR